MAILPPVALTLLLDGRPVRSYEPLYLTRGRVLGPVDPFLTRVADRIGYAAGFAIFVRGGRVVRVRLAPGPPAGLSRTYVALVPLLRALGERVRLDAASETLDVRSPGVPAIGAQGASEARMPPVPPRPVFTPTPVPTERPVWNGTPRPRRTPIPLQAWATPRPR
ncbi:MAG TPA: hypothetical protein VIG46_06225 [Candidatus Baltobacteraceae bacterium]